MFVYVIIRLFRRRKGGEIAVKWSRRKGISMTALSMLVSLLLLNVLFR